MVSTDKLLRHMAWANTEILSQVALLPDAALDSFVVNSEWTVREIIHHYVRSAHFYGYRLQMRTLEDAQDGEPKREQYIQNEKAPAKSTDILPLIEALKLADGVLLDLSREEEGSVYRLFEGEMIVRSRSTIIFQAIHHATEHRAQLASALEVGGFLTFSLDDYDLWAFADKFGE